MEKSIEKPTHSYFITLTYDNENIPVISGRPCFSREHIQTFCDSLRHKLKSRGFRFRYFFTCEYGEEGYRPHYHGIILLYPEIGGSRDRSRYRMARHEFLHRYVEPLWRKGFCYDGNVSLASIMYCTAYALKDDEAIERDWTGFEEGKPFRLFSLKPGLGLTPKCIEWWTLYVYNDGDFRSGVQLHLPKRNVSSGVPVGVKRHIKEDSPELYEAIKAANQREHDETIPYLVDNIRRYGYKTAYASGALGYYFDPVPLDLTPDNDIKVFRKACRELAKRERKPLK